MVVKAVVPYTERGEYFSHHCWLNNWDETLCKFETGHDVDGFAHLKFLRHVQTVHSAEYKDQPIECTGECWHWYPDPVVDAIDFSGDV